MFVPVFANCHFSRSAARSEHTEKTTSCFSLNLYVRICGVHFYRYMFSLDQKIQVLLALAASLGTNVAPSQIQWVINHMALLTSTHMPPDRLRKTTCHRLLIGIAEIAGLTKEFIAM